MNTPLDRLGKDRLRLKLILSAAFMLLVIGFQIWDSYTDYTWSKEQTPLIARMQMSQREIYRLDEVLTTSTRMAVSSGNPEWEMRYHQSVPQLERLLKETLRQDPHPSHDATAKEIANARAALVVLEQRILELVRQGKTVEAQRLRLGEEYEALRKPYVEGMAAFSKDLLQDGDSVGAELLNDLFWNAVTAVASAVLLILGAWFAFRATRRWQAAIEESNQHLNQKTAELVELNNQLDRKVGERTQELNDSVLASMNMMEDAVHQRENAEQAYENLKREEAKLATHVLELARSNEELERFAYVASHDLQEPLRSISSFTDLLLQRHLGQGNKQDDEYATFIKEGVQRMRELLTGILAYTRVSRDVLLPEQVNLNLLLEKVLTNLGDEIREAGGIVTSDPLPALAVDARLFSQLFENLINNAIRFHGTDPPRVYIQAQRQGAQWLFSVRDNGIGIDPKHTERIFVLFQRLHTRALYKGNGLGLAICKKVVERHGGRIWVESCSPGSVVRFTVPDSMSNPQLSKEENLGPRRNAA